MSHKNVFKHDSNTIISVYSELLKNKVGDFLYDPKLSINLIQKTELASFDNINHLKIKMPHDKNSIIHDKTQSRELTGNISRTLSDAMVTSMAECFAIQQGVMNISTFNGKNMPVRDFIQDSLKGESSVPANCERQYIMTVLARLKGAARDSTHGKTFSTITDLIQHLKQRFARHNAY